MIGSPLPGPVIPDAKAAPETGDVMPVLEWVKQENKASITRKAKDRNADRGERRTMHACCAGRGAIGGWDDLMCAAGAARGPSR